MASHSSVRLDGVWAQRAEARPLRRGVEVESGMARVCDDEGVEVGEENSDGCFRVETILARRGLFNSCARYFGFRDDEC